MDTRVRIAALSAGISCTRICLPLVKDHLKPIGKGLPTRRLHRECAPTASIDACASDATADVRGLRAPVHALHHFCLKQLVVGLAPWHERARAHRHPNIRCAAQDCASGPQGECELGPLCTSSPPQGIPRGDMTRSMSASAVSALKHPRPRLTRRAPPRPHRGAKSKNENVEDVPSDARIAFLCTP